MEEFNSDLTIEYQGQEIEVEIKDYSSGYPAKISGPPENCYPGEPVHVEFEISTGNDLLDQLLIENHEDEITDLALNEIEKQKIETENEIASQKYDELRELWS